MIKYLLILYILFFSYSLRAFDEFDLIKLKETGNCLYCNLKNADLGGMNLRGANLEGSFLKGSILIGTDLSYSNLKGANLTSTFIRSTNFCNSIMPEGNISIDGCSNSEIPK